MNGCCRYIVVLSFPYHQPRVLAHVPHPLQHHHPVGISDTLPFVAAINIFDLYIEISFSRTSPDRSRETPHSILAFFLHTHMNE